jgi:ABC-type branched-subunit amino acid transport system substrate-binding protein
LIDHIMRRRDLLRLAMRAGGLMIGGTALSQRSVIARPLPALRLRLGIIAARGAASDETVRGITLGVEEASHTGMLLGITVDLVRIDPVGAPEDALTRLAAEKVHAAIVRLGPAEQAFQEAAAVARFAVIDCSADGLRTGSDACIANVYAVDPGVRARVRALIQFAARSDIRRFGVVDDGSPAARTAVTAVRTQVAEIPGGELAGAASAGDSPAVTDVWRSLSASHGAVVMITSSGAPRAQALAGAQQAGPGAVMALDVFGAADPASDGIGYAAGVSRGSDAPPISRIVTAVWHPSLERYGAGQLNARYRARFGAPMTSPAWLGWMAVKSVFETALRSRHADGTFGAPVLDRDGLRFDGHKGRPLVFAREDHRLRQPLYVVKMEGDAAGPAAGVVAEIPPDPPGESPIACGRSR